MITGADRVYRLATSRASITRMGEGPLVTLNYTAGEVKLDCSDLPADSRVSFQYDMVMSFSAKDGSFVRPDGTGASVAHLVAGLQRTRMTAPKVGLKVETYAISRFSDVLRGQGFADILTHQPRLDPAARPEVRVYQVSSNEVEVRLEIPVNISGDGGARVDTLAIINRYGL